MKNQQPPAKQVVCGRRPIGAYGAAKATTERNPLRQSLTVTTTKGGGFCFSKEVTVYEAKTHLSQLLRRVESGEEIIIRRGKHAAAKLISAAAGNYSSVPDTAKGKVWMAEDFNEPLEDFTEYTG